VLVTEHPELGAGLGQVGPAQVTGEVVGLVVLGEQLAVRRHLVGAAETPDVLLEIAGAAVSLGAGVDGANAGITEGVHAAEAGFGGIFLVAQVKRRLIGRASDWINDSRVILLFQLAMREAKEHRTVVIGEAKLEQRGIETG